jgi:hypothetical protein
MKLSSRYGIGVLCFGLVSAALSPAAFGQQQACVSLLVGAGYAAQMQVCQGTPGGTGNLCGDWTGTFPIGQTQCLPLTMAVGQQFFVNMHAWWGNTIVCSPAPTTRSDFSGNITYQAWGTTLGPSCQMPSSSESADQEKAGGTVNSEGKLAAKRLAAHTKPPADVEEKEKKATAKQQ